MTNPALQLKFGTLEERLAHYCAVFEIERPEIVYEDDSPVLTDHLYAWIIKYDVSFDWLFLGDPKSMICQSVIAQKQARRFQDAIDQLEPEAQKGMTALIKAVVENDLPMGNALELFADAVKDWRAPRVALDTPKENAA